MKVPRVLKRIKTDVVVGENLDAYVAVALGATFTILGVLGSVKQEWLNNFILLTMTFLILVSLRNRYVLQDTQRFLPGPHEHDASGALKDRSDYESLENRLAGAKEVVVVGYHLLGFVSFNKDLIARQAQQGCRFTFVVLDPAQDGLSERVRSDVQRSLDELKGMNHEYPERISVKVTTRALPFSAFVVDMNTVNGLIQIQPHEFFKEAALRPHLDFRASMGSRWYHHYKEQLELLLADSEIIF